MASAGGTLGSCADYLRQTVDCLAAHDIDDPHLRDLQQRVGLAISAA